MVFELQPQIDDESHISTKSQSVFCGQQLAIDLQAHCTCYLHLQSMGSTAFLSIHHKIPYVHLSMSYTDLSPILGLAYRILLFFWTLQTCFFLHTTGLEEWDELLKVGGADGTKLLAQCHGWNGNQGVRCKKLRLLLHTDGDTIQVDHRGQAWTILVPRARHASMEWDHHFCNITVGTTFGTFLSVPMSLQSTAHIIQRPWSFLS